MYSLIIYKSQNRVIYEIWIELYIFCFHFELKGIAGILSMKKKLIKYAYKSLFHGIISD